MRTNRSCVTLWSLTWSFSLSPAAQIGIEVRTVTTATASTQGGGAQTIPANTVLTSGQEVRANYRNSCGSSTAGARVSFQSGAGSADVSLRTDASVVNGAFCNPSPGSASVGRNSFRVSLQAPSPVSGHVVVTVSGRGSTSRNYGNATYASDLGDDASAELTGDTDTSPQAMLAASVERAVVLGPTPLAILLTASAFAGNPYLIGTSGSVELTVAFRAGTGRLGVAGTACGAQLNGTLRQDHTGSRLTLRAASQLGLPWTFLVLGTQDVAFSVPPTQCVLRTDPSTVAPLVLANGVWSLTVDLPEPLQMVDLRTQVLAAVPVSNVLHWHTSEAVLIRLP